MTKGKKLSDFLDEKAKKKLTGDVTAAKADEPSSNVTIHVSGDWFSGDSNQIAHISRGADGRAHKDDSAEKQGRKPVSERSSGEAVNEKHMTPKEYRNFKAGFWDGVETRTGAKNWEAHVWDAQEEMSSVVKENRTSERRQEKQNVSDNRRKSVRRKSDRQVKAEISYNNKMYKVFMVAGVVFYFFWGAMISFGG